MTAPHILEVWAIPKVLVSLRLSEEVVRKLNERASELGIGVTALMRKYIESMLSHQTAGMPLIIIPLDEYNVLLNAVKKAGLMDTYADVASKIYRSLMLLKSQSFPKNTLLSELKDLIETFRVSGKVIDFRVRTTYTDIMAVMTAVSSEVADVLEVLLRKYFDGRKDVEIEVSRVGQTVTFRGKGRKK